MPPCGMFAGFIASLVGIGGGMVMGPLLVYLGMHPQCQAATCAYMLLWTGWSSIMQFYYFGKIGQDWLCWFLFMGFIDSQIGQRFVSSNYLIFFMFSIARMIFRTAILGLLHHKQLQKAIGYLDHPMLHHRPWGHRPDS